MIETATDLESCLEFLERDGYDPHPIDYMTTDPGLSGIAKVVHMTGADDIRPAFDINGNYLGFFEGSQFKRDTRSFEMMWHMKTRTSPQTNR